MDGQAYDDDFSAGWNEVRPPLEPALLADDGEHVVRLLGEYEALWGRLERQLAERLEVLSRAARAA